MTDAYVGRSFPARDNALLAAGRGTFINDLVLPRLAHLALVRSPYAHARIRAIDTRAAAAVPGVLLVLTGADVTRDMAPIPEGWDTSEIGAKGVPWWALAPERTRFVGEAVAAVVAEDRATARAAADLVHVDWEPLPAVTDPLAALEPGSPLVEAAWGDNVLLERTFPAGDVDHAFETAAGTVRGIVRSSRITGVPIEPRGCAADYDPYLDRLTYWDAGQQPHVLRTYLAETLRIPEGSLRVVQPHVGGAFGLKQPTYQEQPLVAYAARRLRRPVKWIEERTESLAVGGHARDTRLEYEAAHLPDGTITGLRVEVIADVGAPTALLGWSMAFVTSYVIPATYRIPNTHVRLRVVVTNKCPWSPYRGFGKDAAAFLMDRVLDDVAAATGLDRATVRFRNFIPPDAFPYAAPSGAILDSGDYPGALHDALERIGAAGFEAEREAARRDGRRLGLGIGIELTPEGVAIPGSLMNSAYDGATIRIAPSGTVTVLAGVTTPGTGNDRGLAQIAADALGCSIERIRVVQGDTDTCPYGLGNYSSRSTMIGGSAVVAACVQLRDRLHAVAARMLETGPGALVGAHDRIAVATEPDRFVGFDDAVNAIYRHTFGRHADGVEPALEATRYYRMPNIYHQPETQGRFSTYPTWPHGAAACVVEVDEESGLVRVRRWTFVEDAGRIINPLLATAQLHGGIAQGLGGALYERVAYDEAGQLLTGTLMDYTIPTAVELPAFDIGHRESPSPFTALGHKGVGESGLGSTLGALCSAIEDAFPERAVVLRELPLTPERVWRAIRDAAPRPTGVRPPPLAIPPRPAATGGPR